MRGWAARDWAGLGWIGLDWTGLDWAGLDWTELDWNGLDWAGLDWTVRALSLCCSYTAPLLPLRLPCTGLTHFTALSYTALALPCMAQLLPHCCIQ